MFADLLNWPHFHPHGVEVIVVLALAGLVVSLGVLLLRSWSDRLDAVIVGKNNRSARRRNRREEQRRGDRR